MQQMPCFSAGVAVGFALLASIHARTGLEVPVVGILVMSFGMAPGIAAKAMATLGGALSAARSMGAPSNNHLFDASREAFVEALQRGSGIAAAAVMATVVLALRILRRSGSDSASWATTSGVATDSCCEAGYLYK